jgi:hypothetical protein
MRCPQKNFSLRQNGGVSCRRVNTEVVKEMRLDKYPHLKRFIDESGLSFEDAERFLMEKYEANHRDDEIDDEDLKTIKGLAGEAKAWKKGGATNGQ